MMNDDNNGGGRDSEDILKEQAERYYRMALLSAKGHDLTAAAAYARYSCSLCPGLDKAARLLDLCLGELGDTEDIRDTLAEIRSFMQIRLWRKAARAAGEIPRQSVRVLNIQGCIYAGEKRYEAAAGFFAKALGKDYHNRLAMEGLAETTGCLKGLTL